MIRLAHLSDIHFGDENRPAVEAATEEVRRAGVDAVVVSGDLTRFGEVKEFAAARAWLDQLPRPLIVTPGNHDAPYLAVAQRVFTPFARYTRAIGPPAGEVLDLPDMVVVAVNSARGAQPRLNWSKGQVTDEQAEWAAGRLQTAAPGALRIVTCHHPLVEMIGGPMTGKVWNGPAMAERLTAARADLVLTGHIHAPFLWPYPYGDGLTHAVGAGTLSVRERGVPPSFNIIEAEAGEIHVRALAFEGAGFTPYRTWSAARREP